MVHADLWRLVAADVLIVSLMVATPAAAQAPAPAPLTQEQRETELRDSWRAGAKVAIKGPATASLGPQGSFRVPQDIIFIPLPEASRIMRALGNTPGPSLVGLVTSPNDKDSWIATISFRKEGYIRDDDAKEWDADELLDNLKAGTQESNKDRRARGYPEVEIVGWVEKPAYDSQAHRLIWSAALKDKNAPDTAERMVNYNTYVLGREGYFSLNFITEASLIEVQKPLARTLLSAISFDLGKRYEDFNASTDQVAAYGLAALVGGAVLKKAGLFAVVAAFAAKFWKVGLLLGVGLSAGLLKFLRRKPSAGT